MDKTMLPHPDVDFFRSNHRPYYIVTAEWVQHSMGTRVTFHLCHILNELGFEAYVAAQNPAPNLRTPLLKPEIIERHKKENRPAIAIYTELLWGNTLEADVVVRLMLNRAGVYGNDIFDTEALYFYWIAGYSTEAEPRLLNFPSVDTHIFNDKGVDNKKRNGFAYFAHKFLQEGKGVIGDKVKNNGISLCKDISLTHFEIADILRRVKVLYVYEDTALVIEAAMCGCPVIYVKTDFFAGMEKAIIDGATVLSENEIDTNSYYPTSDSPKEWIDNFFKNSYRYLNDFVNITQQAPLGYTGKDSLLEYCKKYKHICIYGCGIFGSMVFNALCASEISIECFIISEDHVDNNAGTYLGMPVRPLSWYIGRSDSECGLVVAMVRSNSEQVIPDLIKHGIDFFT